MKKSKLINDIVFLLLLSFVCFIVQNVVVPSRTWPYDHDNTDIRFRSFYELNEDSVDCVFLGTSHMGSGVQPLKIYREYGITSYNLSSSSQMLYDSEYLVEEVFKTQNPKVIMLDASSLYLEYDSSRRVYLRTISDRMRLSWDSLEFLFNHQYIYDTDDNATPMEKLDRKLITFLSYVFPIIQYHDRWSEINESNVLNLFNSSNWGSFALGYFLHTGIKSTSEAAMENMNSISDGLFENRMYSYNIPEDNVTILEDLVETCEKHGCQLVLVKIPSVADPRTYHSAWTRVKYESLCAFAENEKLQFYDILYDSEYELNASDASRDGGFHMSYRASSEISSIIGGYLSTDFKLLPHSDSKYDEYLELFSSIESLIDFQTTTDIDSYIDILDRYYSDNCLIIICASDDAECGLTQTMRRRISSDLGIDFSYGFRESYIAVVDRSECVYENHSCRKLVYESDYDSDVDYSASSSGFWAGSGSSIIINGVDYSQHRRGLNIVVFDYESMHVIDSLSVDFSSEDNATIQRDSEFTNNLFWDYMVSYVYDYDRNS